VEPRRQRGEKQVWDHLGERNLPNALSPWVAEMGLRFIFAAFCVHLLPLSLPWPRRAAAAGLIGAALWKENKGRDRVQGIPAALDPERALCPSPRWPFSRQSGLADWVLKPYHQVWKGRAGDEQ